MGDDIISSRFARLIWPIAPETFFSDAWEKQPLVVRRRDANVYRDLLSIDDVDEALTTLNLSYPEIRLARVDQPLDPGDYTFPDGRIDPLAVTKLFRSGVTIVFDQMQRRLPSLGELCRDLESELGIAFQTNLYVTPPHAGGFKGHYDTHDVFVLQIVGSKQWELFESLVELPMPGQHGDDNGTAPGKCTHRFRLHAGDLVYLPRGIYHQARANDEVSMHVTLGAMVRTWCEFLLEAVSELSLRDVAFRRALPIGIGIGKFDHGGAQKEFQSLLTRLAASSDFERTAHSLSKEFVRKHDGILRQQLLQISSLGNLSSESVVVARKGAVRSIERVGDKLAVCHLNTAIELPAHVEKSLSSALSGAPLRVADIAGELDLGGKITLARTLIEEGLLVIVASAASIPKHEGTE